MTTVVSIITSHMEVFKLLIDFSSSYKADRGDRLNGVTSHALSHMMSGAKIVNHSNTSNIMLCLANSKGQREPISIRNKGGLSDNQSR